MLRGQNCGGDKTLRWLRMVMGMLRLLLVRHGESIWNEEDRIQGQQDVPLSERGRQQAIVLGKWLKGVPIDACYASPLSRAMETAQLMLEAMAQKVLVRPLPALMERAFGEWEGKQVSEVKERYPNEFAQWVAQHYAPAPPGGESLSEFLSRVEQGLMEIVRNVPNGTVLMVGHSGSVKAAFCILFRLPLSSFARLRISNASLTVVELWNGQAWLLAFNDTCHLDTMEKNST